MQQHPLGPLRLYQVFSHFKPDLIITLGTGDGELDNVLGHYWKLKSYDIEDRRSFLYCHKNYPDRQQDYGGRKDTYEFKQCDIFSAEIVDEIRYLIANHEKVAVLCDNGDKPKEVALFSGMIKPTDIILAHDYTSCVTWGWDEFSDADIPDRIQKHPQYDLEDCAWFVGKLK